MTGGPWERVRNAGGRVVTTAPRDGWGVYVVREEASQRVVYVGQSCGHLRRTLLRHFQRWRQDRLHPEPRQVYDADGHAVSWRVTPRERRAVSAAEREAMRRHRPRDNHHVPADVVVEEGCDVAPF